MKKNPSVVSYYHSKESYLGYKYLLKGVKHFGFFPKGKEQMSLFNAQELMDDELGKALHLPKQSIVLDAGCGEGSVARYLARHFSYRVEGIDLLDFNIKNAQQEAIKQGLQKAVHYQVGDYSTLPFPDNHFDGVYTMETLVHSPDYKKTLKEFYRVLKPGGKLVLFEYSMKPYDELSSHEKEMTDIINIHSSMPSFYKFTHNSFPHILKEAKFEKVTTREISEHIFETAQRFYHWALPVYPIIRLLHAESHFVNVIAGRFGREAIEKGIWKYIIVSGTKPHAKS